jgi:hypothetical protein
VLAGVRVLLVCCIFWLGALGGIVISLAVSMISLLNDVPTKDVKAAI